MFQTVAVAVFVFSLVETGDAALTEWTCPVSSSSTYANGTVPTTVPEDKTGALNITFAAKDATLYEITEQTPGNVFLINSTTGVLSIAAGQKLDYENHKSHVVIVTASETTNTGTASVIINISDVNEFDPAFASVSFAVNIPDNSTKGTSVITVKAKDDDGSSTNKVPTYKLVPANNTNSDFDIDANGTITVVNTLHAKKTPKYTLVVQAIDGGTPPRTGYATVNVCVGCQSGEGVPVINFMLILASVLFGIKQNSRVE